MSSGVKKLTWSLISITLEALVLAGVYLAGIQVGANYQADKKAIHPMSHHPQGHSYGHSRGHG